MKKISIFIVLLFLICALSSCELHVVNYTYVSASSHDDFITNIYTIFDDSVYISFTRKDVYTGDFSIQEARYTHEIICDKYQTNFSGIRKQVAFGATYYDKLILEENNDGYIKVTEDNKEMVLHIINQYLSVYNVSLYYKGEINQDIYGSFLFKKIISLSK